MKKIISIIVVVGIITSIVVTCVNNEMGSYRIDDYKSRIDDYKSKIDDYKTQVKTYSNHYEDSTYIFTYTGKEYTYKSSDNNSNVNYNRKVSKQTHNIKIR